MNAIVAIDRSGSMSGGPIRDARGALISLVKKFQKADVPMVVYTFSSSFQCYDSDEIGHEGLLEQAENLKAGGGT